MRLLNGSSLSTFVWWAESVKSFLERKCGKRTTMNMLFCSLDNASEWVDFHPDAPASFCRSMTPGEEPER